MKGIVLVRPDPAVGGRAAAEWAAEEARLRGLPLRSADGVPGPAELAVVGTGAQHGDTGPAAAFIEASAGPVVVVPDPSPGSSGTFMPDGDVTLGIDARDPAGACVGFAFAAALLRGAGLRAVYAWSLPASAARLPFAVPEADRAEWEDEETQWLSDALRPRLLEFPDVPVVREVVRFTPVRALVRHCADSSLVVVGRRPGRPPGTVVRALLRSARCPVAVIASPPCR
ncbi:universal stress protein [Streptomyces sp. NPDC023723]|uniref:universal stress protein n=1 Tax=Streptomyces sp. NPDC023723 TaxID=3154323 RepID=UPI003404FAA8